MADTLIDGVKTLNGTMSARYRLRAVDPEYTRVGGGGTILILLCTNCLVCRLSSFFDHPAQCDLAIQFKPRFDLPSRRALLPSWLR